MSNPNCLLHNQEHDQHQLAGPGGAKPGAWCSGFTPVEFGAHDQAYVQAHQKPQTICPECAAGKCGICARQALDEANDLIVDCTCDHGGAS